jgi:hypothetical protein
MTIHAFTDQGASCPAYINVSERVANPGDVVVTVRSAGENNASAIILDRSRAIALAHDILRHYSAPAPDVKAAVDRFLGWPLPKTFSPDCYIHFDRPSADLQGVSWPSGTNVFNAEEARAMFEHALGVAEPKTVGQLIASGLNPHYGGQFEGETAEQAAARRAAAVNVPG